MIDKSLNERSMKGQSAPCGHILGDLAICSECVAVGSCTSGSPYMLDRACRAMNLEANLERELVSYLFHYFRGRRARAWCCQNAAQAPASESPGAELHCCEPGKELGARCALPASMIIYNIF